MLKLELLQAVGIKQRLGVLVETMIAIIVRFEDYAVYKQVKLSEALLLAFALFRAIWFSLFGVQNANYDYFFTDSFWIAAFWTITILHCAGLLTHFKWCCQRYKKLCLSSKSLRLGAIRLHAFVWLFLTVLALISRTSAPAVPFLGILFVFSIVVIVRLSREEIRDE